MKKNSSFSSQNVFKKTKTKTARILTVFVVICLFFVYFIFNRASDMFSLVSEESPS